MISRVSLVGRREGLQGSRAKQGAGIPCVHTAARAVMWEFPRQVHSDLFLFCPEFFLSCLEFIFFSCHWQTLTKLKVFAWSLAGLLPIQKLQLSPEFQGLAVIPPFSSLWCVGRISQAVQWEWSSTSCCRFAFLAGQMLFQCSFGVFLFSWSAGTHFYSVLKVKKESFDEGRVLHLEPGRDLDSLCLV